MSCANPNLQNLPRDDEVAQAVIRRAFINPSPETQMLYCDYSQIEMVIFASISGDARLKQAVIDGEDLHTVTAALLFDVSTDAVTKQQRSIGKTMNFAIIYGQGAPSTAIKLKVSEDEARRFRAQYFAVFPAIKQVQQNTMAHIKRTGYAKTLYGRVRPIQKDKAYIGLNTIVQGTAADIMKVGMLRVAKYLTGKKSKLLLPIHDELVIEHHLSEPIIRPIKRLMTGKLPIDLPLRVKVEATTTNWTEAQELTDELLLSRVADRMDLPTMTWSKIEANAIEVQTPWFDQSLWLVPEKTDAERLELVV
jgi:DNA polymerase-1